MFGSKTFCEPTTVLCPSRSIYPLRCLGLILLILGLLLSPTALLAAQVTLAWDASGPEAEGYRVFRRLGGQRYIYAQPVWSGPETTCVVPNLPERHRQPFCGPGLCGCCRERRFQ